MPALLLAPNAVGCWSERSNRKVSVEASVLAARRVRSSGYPEGSTPWLGEVNPARCAHTDAASGVARKASSFWAAGLSVRATPMSPPPTTAGGEPLIDGKSKKARPVSGDAAWARAYPSTKSPSKVVMDLELSS